MLRRFAVFALVCVLAGAAFAAPHDDTHAAKTAAPIQTVGPVTEHQSGPPQFAVETFPSQLFWLVVSFGTLYLLFSGAALPRIQQGITARAGHIHNLLGDARRLRDEAEQHKNDMSSAADAAYQRAHALLNKAAAESQEIANRRNHELEAIMQTKQKISEEKIAIARANAVQSVRDATQMLIPIITQKLAGLPLSDSQIATAISSAQSFNDNGSPRTAARGAA